MKPKHIVVVDGLWVGHHPIYVKTFAKVLLGAGYRVTVLCPAPEEVYLWLGQTVAVENGRFKALQFSEREPVVFKCFPSRVRHAFLSLARWWQVSRSMKAMSATHGMPDLVFFAWLDSYVGGYVPVKLIDRQFPFLWSGLFFHPRHLRALGEDGKPKKGRFPLPESFMAKSKWASSLAVLDAGVLNLLRAELHGKLAVALPDFTDELPPAEHCPLAEAIRLKSRGRKIIGLLGGLARRKGLLTLIRIVKQAVQNNWYFVFAGVLLEQTFSKDELAEAQDFFSAQRDDSFFYLNKIPDDAQFNAVLNGCDVIFAMYENFPHSSNLVTKAALYGKRILVSSGGYMEEVVRRYQLGEVVPARDVKAALTALHRLTETVVSPEASAGMQEYAKQQSQEKLRGAILNLIESSTHGSLPVRTVPFGKSLENRDTLG